jgi:hypothetical protein
MIITYTLFITYIQHVIWAKNIYHERIRIPEGIFSTTKFLLNTTINQLINLIMSLKKIKKQNAL